MLPVYRPAPHRGLCAALLTSTMLLVCGLFVRPVEAADSPVWRTDFQAALAEAEQAGRPLLLHFYADWCLPCRQMEGTVFADPQVLQTLGDRFIAVKLNFDHNRAVAQQFSVNKLPSDVVFNPTNGHLLAHVTGPQDRGGYLTMMARTASRFEQQQSSQLVRREPRPPQPAETPLPAESPASQSPETTDSPQVADSETTIDLGEPQPVVGLEGFSPVLLGLKRKWVRGSAEQTWEHKGVVYHFTNREELLQFRSDPDLYAPRLLGCDPVLLVETDRAIAGTTQFAAYFDGELYLFTAQETRARFKQRPALYTRLQHVLKVHEIERPSVRLTEALKDAAID